MKTKHIAYIAMGCAAAFAVTSCEKEGPRLERRWMNLLKKQ